MSKCKETGVYSQGKGKPYSFKLKSEYDDLFKHIHYTLELLNGGESLTKTQVMEWMMNVAAQSLTEAEHKAMKQYRMQKATA